LRKIRRLGAKPFVKWTGGKSRLLDEISKKYLFESGITKYIEPFLGGGAVAFDVLNKYNLDDVYLLDNNEELIYTYHIIQNHVDDLIPLLENIQCEYDKLDERERETYFYNQRNQFNKCKFFNVIERAALLLFLNHTCYNGLYRVNSKGEFNTPICHYKNPRIYDKDNLLAAHKALQGAKLINADYSYCERFVDNKTLLFLDPQRIDASASNIQKEKHEQNNKKICEFIMRCHEKGAKILLSSFVKNNTNSYFADNLSTNIFQYEFIKMKNCIANNGDNRTIYNELLISNF
jgi:DNA adenine methylase